MAHSSDHRNTFYLAGKLLLAMPGIGDPRFHKAAILICAHDQHGAMGLVVNQNLPHMDFSSLLAQLGISSDITVKGPKMPVLCGGPVESARGFLLHSSEFTQPETVRVDQDFSVTGTLEALRDLAAGHGPQNALFILGYAGWGSGQLEQEIRDNAWLTVSPDPAIIFHPNADEKWALAIAKLGFDPAQLSAQSGRA